MEVSFRISDRNNYHGRCFFVKECFSRGRPSCGYINLSIELDTGILMVAFLLPMVCYAELDMRMEFTQ